MMNRVYFNSVFVSSINKEKASGRIVVTASNGSPEGPPLVHFELSEANARKCVLNKRYILTIEEDKET